MKIKNAIYIESTTGADTSQSKTLPEFAFIGRSNVGKSSLINMLCNKRKLAHTSATPGKTQTVNRFMVNETWNVVDLPGYGFAKVSDKTRARLKRIIWDYIDGSENMVLLFVLIDSRHELMKVDLEFLTKLGERGVPFAIVFTKADKNSKTALQKNTESIRNKLLEYWEELPPCFTTSSMTGEGRDEMLGYIGEILKDIHNNQTE